MKCLVAGGTGAIGKLLVPKLVKMGYEVGVITRSDKKSEWVTKQGAKAHQIDLFNLDKVKEVAKNYEIMIHTATSIPAKSRTKYSDWEMNTKLRTKGTEILLQAAIENKYKLYIQESFFGIYGNQDGKLLTESNKISNPVITKVKLRKDFQRNYDCLVEMENKVIKANKEQNLPTIILRFGLFYSSDGSALIPALATNQFPIIGGGVAYNSLISLEDVSEAIIASIKNHDGNTGEIYNICDDEPVKYKDLINFANGITGKKTKSVPKILVRLIFGSWGLNFFTSSCKMSNKKAKEKLKWKPKYPTYREGVAVEIKKFLETN